MNYIFSLTLNPSFAILSSKEQFVYIECRVGQVTDYFKDTAIKHVDYLNDFKIQNNLKGYLQLRRIFYNDKGGTYECVVDYLTDNNFEKIADFKLKNDIHIIDGNPTFFDFQIISSDFGSDHFDKNHRDFYSNIRVIPWITDFDNYLLTRNLSQIKK